MTDSPGSGASAADSTSIAEAELQLAGALQGGLCADPFGALGPHQGTKPGQFRLRVFVPGGDGVMVLARETREPLAQQAEAVPARGFDMSLSLTLPPLGVLWLEPEPAT